ncbi:phosphoribosylamine--glycine ligase [Helicobacter cetorum]|uniref:phosphoribosylamine--glycine ligase n=1 Tax=Helicobacter cetorum TaxID=138563 RepID=UPI000CF18E80|nr:phosphoribosylamine--glycine ligase [Helicobacter cetorum]
MKDNNYYNVLIVGGGGREYALGKKLQEDQKVSALYFCPGNGGTQDLGENLECEDDEQILDLALKKQIHLAIISEENPLVLGLTDKLEKAGILVFGPSKENAHLEGSKSYMKAFAKECHIKTAPYFETSDFNEALDYLKSTSYPLVIKADGLCRGKGVCVASNQQEAIKTLEEMMQAKIFGKSGEHVIIEQFLEGFELSAMAVVAHEDFILLPFCQDHKRLLDEDKGPNTGGMGAFAPASFCSNGLEEKIKNNIFKPALKKLKENNTPFKGVLFAGIMVVEEEGELEPYLLEFNVRFGDPECQTILPLLESSLLDLCLACAKGDLNGIKLEFSKDFVLSITLASRNYPYDSSPKQTLYIDPIDEKKGHIVFAGVAQENGVFESVSGRVLFAVGKGKSLLEAKNNAYEIAQKVHFEGMQYRKDIGFRVLERTSLKD